MPKYSYHCVECGDAFEIIHSIKERKDDCIVCSHSGSLERIPFIPITLVSKRTGHIEAPVGKLTEEFIKDASEELKEEKKKLKKEVYEP
jgi:putative FmdB family regulatory protein